MAAGAVLILAGILEIIQKRCLFLSSRKYTEESLKEASKYDGIVEILFGLAAIALNYGETGRKICLVLVIGGMMIFARVSGKYLKKK